MSSITEFLQFIHNLNELSSQEPKTSIDRSSRPDNLQFHRTTILSATDCRDTLKPLFADENNPTWIQLSADLDQTMICTTNTNGTGICKCIFDSFSLLLFTYNSTKTSDYQQ